MVSACLVPGCGSDDDGGGSGGSGGSGTGGSGTGGTAGSGTGGAAGSGTGGSAGSASGGTAGSGTGGAGTGGAGGKQGSGQSKSQKIGAAGGSITFELVTLTIPAGALAADTDITITSVAKAGTGAFLSPVYKFDPPLLTFSKPAHVKFALPSAPPSSSNVYWTTDNSTSMSPLTTTKSGNDIEADITKFSCGAPCYCATEPCACTAPAPECQKGGSA
ncbi:MAG: hypothetical protein AMXMBFR56_56570 [Polyangiaceae bacterium]